MRDFAADLRQGWRNLLREPGFPIACILMLGLGLGVTTAVFSLVNGVLLNPLAYRNPERLVTIREVVPKIAHLYPSLPVNAYHFLEFRKECPSIESMAVVDPTSLNLTGSGEPERIDAARVSANLFRVLGISPARGRDFRDEEELAGKDLVVILTDGLWRRRFNADPQVVGKTIMLGGRAHTVIGVLPPDFRFPDRNVFGLGQSVAPHTELFRPKVFEKDELAEVLGRFNYGVVARLRPGVSRQRVRDELEAVLRRIEAQAGEDMGLRALVSSFQDVVVGKARRGLLVLMGAVAGVLLIIGVNLANLLLARGERRAQEFAVRAALGAGRARLVWSAFAETSLIAVAGGVLALGVAALSIGLLRQQSSLSLPRLDEVSLDSRVFGFAIGLMALTAAIFGFLPAWRASRSDPQAALRARGRTMTDSLAGRTLRSTLVASEVGLSALLLILAGLLINSFVRLVRADAGFSAPTVLAVDIALAGDTYGSEAAREGFYRRVLGSLAEQGEVRAAAISSALPLQGETWIDNVSAYSPPAADQETPVNVRFVSYDYFRTLGIPLLAGRTFRGDDRGRSVSIVSARLAAFLWPGRDPIGRKFTRGNNQWFEVIGVAGDLEPTPTRLQWL